MNSDDTLAPLLAAIETVNKGSSDFDLNPEFALPPTRVLKDAGVLVPLFDRGGEWVVILTKRSSELKHHPGQIAFPGGKVDPGDDGPVAAALREAEEEIGLMRDNVEVLATLPAHETVTSYLMTPVLGRVRDDFDAIAEIGEVAEVFEVPLKHVLDPARYSIQGRYWRGQLRQYYAVPYGPYYIWGATARVLYSLASATKS